MALRIVREYVTLWPGAKDVSAPVEEPTETPSTFSVKVTWVSDVWREVVLQTCALLIENVTTWLLVHDRETL